MQQGMFDNSGTTVAETFDDIAIQAVLDEITEEVMLGFCFEVHRAVKLNYFFLDEESERNRKNESVVLVGEDVFGQNPREMQFKCVCPKCGHSMAAQRFAPHLEKCIKSGRQSFRKAKERISTVTEIDTEVESDCNDGKCDNDSDWGGSKDKKAAKRKKDKNSVKNAKKNRKTNKPPLKNGEPKITTNESITDPLVSTLEEKRAFLNQMCGVISERTKRMCTKPLRCPQHTDEQRRFVRLSLLGINSGSYLLPDEVPIDVDTVDEGFWDQGNSRNTSPADFSSSANALKRRDKKKVTFKL